MDAFIKRARNKDALKSALFELDGSWCKIYERACTLLKEKEALTESLNHQNTEYERLKQDYDSLFTELQVLRASNKETTIKNRYLTNMIREYLYAAVANEILIEEGSLTQVDTKVTPIAMEELVDADIPMPFSTSVKNDRHSLSREELLLKRMADNIGGSNET